MSAVAHPPSRQTGRSGQTALRRLAAVLGFICLVLLLLAVDQRQAVEAAGAVRDAAAPVAGRLWTWAGRLPAGEARGWTGLKQAWIGDGVDRTRSAAPRDVLLTGEYTAADDPTRAATGNVVFAGARIQFERAGAMRTGPLRIGAGRDAWSAGQTFAARLAAAPDAQIELRAVVPAGAGQAVAPSPLCGGEVPAAVALLHRSRTVDVMLFREGFVVGAEAPPRILCGAWRYRGN